MAEIKSVSTGDDVEYTLYERLGGGAIAAVYRGETASGQVAAVKLSHAIHPDLRKQFNTEFETLNRILEAGADWPAGAGRPPVPGFVKRAGEDALVVEFVDAPSLGSQIQGDDLAVRQEKLVEPAWQYAWLLDLLHNPEVDIGQLDRKGPDLRWDAEDKRLVVLDWNLVSDAERAPEDVYQFGAMWYAFLLDVPPLLGADYSAHPQWEDLSVAWREVLKACLRVDRSTRPNARKLQEMLGRLREAYRRPGDTLLREGWGVLDSAKNLPGHDAERWKELERAWRLLDLAERKGVAMARERAAEARTLLERRGQKSLDDAKGCLMAGTFEQAKPLLGQAEAELGGDLEGRLRVARWRCLYEASQFAKEATLAKQLRTLMPTLTKAVEKLEASEWQAMGSNLSVALAELPDSETRRILESLETEANLRSALKEAREAEASGAFERAKTKYQEARGLLGSISYVSALKGTLPDLAEAQRRCERRAKTEGRLQEILEELPKAVENGDYGQAHALIAEGHPLSAADRQARQKLEDAYAPVKGLAELRQLRRQAGVSDEELVKRAADLHSRWPDHRAVAREVGQTVEELVTRLKQRTELKCGPSEVKGALEMGRAVQELVGSLPVTVLETKWVQEVQIVVGKLQAKQEVQVDLLEKYKQAETSEDKATMAAIAGRAKAAGVELFDDPGLKVATLAEADRVERQASRSREVKGKLEEVLEELQQLLQARADAVSRLVGQIQGAADWAKPEKQEELEERLGQIRDLANRADDYSKSLERLPGSETIASLQTAADETEVLRTIERLDADLNRFYREEARQWWTLLVQSSAPSVRQGRYRSQCKAFEAELKRLEKLGEHELRWLRDARAHVAGGGELNQKRIGQLRALYEKSQSAAVMGLWQTVDRVKGVDAPMLAISREYEQAQAEAQTDLVKELGQFRRDKPDSVADTAYIDRVGSAVTQARTVLDAFDEQWAERSSQEPGTALRHADFVCSWLNRFSEVLSFRNYLWDALADLRGAMSSGNRLDQLLDMYEQWVKRTRSASNEVLWLFQPTWQWLLDKLINELAPGPTGMRAGRQAKQEVIDRLKDPDWADLILFEQKARAGERFYSPGAVQRGDETEESRR